MIKMLINFFSINILVLLMSSFFLSGFYSKIKTNKQIIHYGVSYLILFLFVFLSNSNFLQGFSSALLCCLVGMSYFFLEFYLNKKKNDFYLFILFSLFFFIFLIDIKDFYLFVQIENFFVDHFSQIFFIVFPLYLYFIWRLLKSFPSKVPSILRIFLQRHSNFVSFVKTFFKKHSVKKIDCLILDLLFFFLVAFSLIFIYFLPLFGAFCTYSCLEGKCSMVFLLYFQVFILTWILENKYLQHSAKSLYGDEVFQLLSWNSPGVFCKYCAGIVGISIGSAGANHFLSRSLEKHLFDDAMDLHVNKDVPSFLDRLSKYGPVLAGRPPTAPHRSDFQVNLAKEGFNIVKDAFSHETSSSHQSFAKFPPKKDLD